MTNLTPEQQDFLQREAYDQGTQVAQIFSGIFFSGLAAWLSVTNGTKLAFVQRAALEKRLTVCCFLNVYVGCFSAFFNFFQLTAVDDVILPDTDSFTLDLSRPIEWVLTCPLMQLSLVLMGGIKLPEYRRFLMPGFSVFILSCGTTAAMLNNIAGKLICYAIGVCGFCAMAFFNRLQIIEYSGGDEGMLSGDSEFRKATLLLLSTWAPFPMWFIMSPEGFGIITNVLLIQVGWAFLNIVSKFVFIFYIQRVKDLYCNRLKTKRELGAGQTGKNLGHHRHGSVSPPDLEFSGALMPGDFESKEAYEAAEAERKKEKLAAVVVETMTFLGMAQHTDRFLALLDRAEIHTVNQVEQLSRDNCEELQIPYDLVSALQKRLRVWKLEMVDDAEMGLEKGEEHYVKKALDMPKLIPEDGSPNGAHQQLPNMMPPMVNPMMAQMVPHQMMAGYDGVTSPPTGMETPRPVVSEFDFDALVQKTEEKLQKTEDKILDSQNTRAQHSEKTIEQFTTSLKADLGTFEKRLVQQVSSQLDATSKTSEQRGELRAFENRMYVKLDEVSKSAENRHEIANLEKRLISKIEQHLSVLSTKIDVVCQKSDACGQKVDSCTQKVDVVTQKVDTAAAGQQALLAESMVKVGEKIDEVTSQMRSGFELLLQRCEAVQTAQAKLAADGEHAWRQRLEELETSMVCREDEAQAAHKRQYEEILRNAGARRLDDLAAQLARASEKSESAIESLNSGLNSELQTLGSRVLAKVESAQAAQQRAQADSEAAVLQRLEESAERTSQATQNAATQAAQQAAQAVGQQTTEKTVQAVEGGLQRVEGRLDGVDGALKQVDGKVDAAQQASHGGVQKILMAVQLTEKATEMLDGSVKQKIKEATELLEGGTHKRLEKAVEVLDGCMQKRMERVEEAASSAVLRATTETAQQVGQRVERAVESIEHGLQKRLDEAVAKAAAEGSASGSSHAAHRTEKALEAMETSQRGELHSAMTTLAERIDEAQGAQLRKVAEREERSNRRLEELLELTTSRSMQKVDDVGMDLKKELHGFAKRLNSKIPFM